MYSSAMRARTECPRFDVDKDFFLKTMRSNLLCELDDILAKVKLVGQVLFCCISYYNLFICLLYVDF